MKLNYKRTFFVGLAFLSISAFWQMYDNVIQLMLKYTFDLGETVTGFLLALDNIVAILLIPLFGAFSDKVNTRLGKRTPFIIIGTIAAVIAMSFIPLADRSANLVMFLIFLGIVLVAMGSYRSPAVSLMPDITPKPLRSKANAIINLMGAIGAIYSILIIKLFIKDEVNGYTKIFSAVSVLMIAAVIILVIKIKENKLVRENNLENPWEDSTDDQKQTTISETKQKTEISSKESDKMPKEVKKSFILILASIFLWFFAYNAITSAYSRYVEEVWHMERGGFTDSLLIAMGAAILSYIPIGIISSKFGRKKTIIAGILMVTASYLCGALFINYSVWINVVFAFTGIGWAAISVNSYPMVVEMSKGSSIGRYTGYYYFFSMLSQTITPIVSGAFLEFVSYRTLFPYALIFSIASLCTMIFVKHGDSKPIKKSSVIENFDTDD